MKRVHCPAIAYASCAKFCLYKKEFHVFKIHNSNFFLSLTINFLDRNIFITEQRMILIYFSVIPYIDTVKTEISSTKNVTCLTDFKLKVQFPPLTVLITFYGYGNLPRSMLNHL